MLVVTCPGCRSTIVRNTDGTCPVCGKLIPPGEVEPFVVTTQGAADQGPTGKPREPAPGPPFFGEAPGRRPADSASGPQAAILRFRYRLWEITPHLFVTQMLVALNILIFVLMVFSGVGLLTPSVEGLITWGANFGPKTLAGEWWRLLTCTFVHIGLVHIALNMWVLWDLGQLVERLVGNVGFVVLYVISGLAGSLASVYWNPNVISAGASGAIFGVFGAMMGFILLRGDSVPKQILGGLRNSGFTFLLFNLLFGLSVKGIDMAAHAGGLVAGFVCGVLMSQPLDRVSPMTRGARNVLALVAGAVGIAVAILAAPSAPAGPRAEVCPPGIIRETSGVSFQLAMPLPAASWKLTPRKDRTTRANGKRRVATGREVSTMDSNSAESPCYLGVRSQRPRQWAERPRLN